jgi:putative heme-binding domain-containing protein
LESLADQQHPGLAESIPDLVEQPALRRDAIEAVAAYDRQALGEMLLERYGSFSPTEKNAALRSLAARPTSGWLLTQAIESGEIAKSEVPPDVARQLRRVVGSGFVEVWGPIDGSAVDVETAFEEYRALLTDEAIAEANPHEGRLVYEETCGTCHRMYGEGGLVGPDLTGSNRQNVDYVLSNVLQPSATIQDDYRMVIVTTTGGRTLVGSIANETERQLTLRLIGRGEVVLPKSEIQSRETSGNSLMPTGLFASLSESEILDLMAYLRTDEQVPTPGD